MTTDELREIASREPLAQAICGAVNANPPNDELAGYLLRASVEFLEGYRMLAKMDEQADQLRREIAATNSLIGVAGRTP